MNTPYFNNFMPQPGQFGMPQMQAPTQQMNQIQFVNGIESAKAFTLRPNQSVISATAAGTNQVQLYANGTAVPGAIAQVTTTAADNVITLPVSAVIQAAPAAPGNKVALTWVTSAAGTLINASETVSRIV